MRPEKARQLVTRVAAILRDERERKQLSMTRVAETAGLSQQMVSYVERGLRTPTLETLFRMCAAIGIDLTDVIREAQKMK